MASDTALTGYRGALVMAGLDGRGGCDRRSRVARADFPVVDRVSILAMLDAASTIMDGEAWLPEWADAHRQIESAKTALVQASAESMKARFAGGRDRRCEQRD